MNRLGSIGSDVDVKIDTSAPHMARVYDYLLGGTVNFPVDRQHAEHVTAALPGGIEAARRNVRANRAFLASAVHHLAAVAGLRQFLDIGTGIPNEDNVHGVAQQAAPDACVVYVDHDPIVLAHARTLLQSTPQGATDYVDGDLRDPDGILLQAARTLDFDAPVALLLVGVLHYIRDEQDPYEIVTRLLGALAPGSHLVISHLASDIQADEMAEMTRRHNDAAPVEPAVIRGHGEVARFFGGLELMEPGLVPLHRWHRPGLPPGEPDGPDVPIYGGIARKT